mgnify:CR=1 FL=1
MLKKNGWEYWDSEGVPTRVHEISKEVQRYHAGGEWKKDSSQRHPRTRGMSSSSDHSPISDDADLKHVIETHEACERERAEGK